VIISNSNPKRQTKTAAVRRKARAPTDAQVALFERPAIKWVFIWWTKTGKSGINDDSFDVRGKLKRSAGRIENPLLCERHFIEREFIPFQEAAPGLPFDLFSPAFVLRPDRQGSGDQAKNRGSFRALFKKRP
jgi:hypothetical protein